MNERTDGINRLRLAEHQFRLACTVNLAASNEVQTLDVPIEWTFGKHRVHYEEFGLGRIKLRLLLVSWSLLRP